MRQWTYSWTSSDGLRHEGEIRARDKDSAFAELRSRGIHPIRVTERIVPVVRRGLRGLRKRDMTLLALCVLGLLLFVWYFAVATAVKGRSDTDLAGLSVESIINNPKSRDEIRRVIEERKALEAEYRMKFIQRVKEGSLSRESANQMFRAMGMEELK